MPSHKWIQHIWKKLLKLLKKVFQFLNLRYFKTSSFFAVAVSTDCLAVLLCEMEDIHPIGEALGITENNLSAIDSYYDDKGSKFNHTLMLWKMEDPQDPAETLIRHLKQMGRYKISETLTSLSSFGMLYIYIRYCFIVAIWYILHV